MHASAQRFAKTLNPLELKVEPQNEGLFRTGKIEASQSVWSFRQTSANRKLQSSVMLKIDRTNVNLNELQWRFIPRTPD